jgi:hypothetical protein
MKLQPPMNTRRRCAFSITFLVLDKVHNSKENRRREVSIVFEVPGAFQLVQLSAWLDI